MKKDEVKDYLNQKVYILLKNNFNYTCQITDIGEDSFSGIDKYGNRITILFDMIALLEAKE